MDASVSGRNAETVYRDQSGNKYASRAEYLEAINAEKKEKEKKHLTEGELEWGGGIKQKKEKKAMREAMAAEVSQASVSPCLYNMYSASLYIKIIEAGRPGLGGRK
eukprot:scaffold184063_cov22-Prasinocladus_malaysianus.AAC.1